MSLRGTITTTPAAYLAAVLQTLTAEHAARSPAPGLAYCGIGAPADLLDGNGAISVPTPAIVLEIGESALIIDSENIGRSSNGEGELLTVNAYHIIGLNGRALPAQPMHQEAWQLASITRAILRAPDTRGRRGQRWGLGDAVDVPQSDSISHAPVYPEQLSGYALRQLTWRQAVCFVDTTQ